MDHFWSAVAYCPFFDGGCGAPACWRTVRWHDRHFPVSTSRRRQQAAAVQSALCPTKEMWCTFR